MYSMIIKVKFAYIVFFIYACLFMAMLHDAIFLATCNAVLLFNDVKLANTRF